MNKDPFVKSHLKINKLINLLILIILFIFLSSLVKNIVRMRRANQKLEKARISLQEAEKHKDELAQELQTVKSEEFLEKGARDKLGLAKKGDIVLILPEESVLRSLSPREETSSEEEFLPDPNWKKWLKLFI